MVGAPLLTQYIRLCLTGGKGTGLTSVVTVRTVNGRSLRAAMKRATSPPLIHRLSQRDWDHNE
jgi:hypothetical protein